VQGFDSPAASRLLFGIAQKVGKKARHRTRWSDSHRANRTALCFSARRGCSDSTSMYCFAIAAIHRRDPSGIFPSRLRCSAPRTAPVFARMPSIHGLRRSGRLGKCAVALLLIFASASAAGCRQKGAPRDAANARRKVRRRARTMRARSLHVHGRTFSEPRSAVAYPQGRRRQGCRR
jgi:hypothetical protein